MVMLFISGCASTLTREQLHSENYGEGQGQEYYIEKINQYLNDILIDPGSLRLACAEAQPGAARNLSIDPYKFGWVVYCKVNTKNKFGGYTGNKPHVYLFQGTTIVVKNTYGDAKLGRHFQYK